MCVLFHCRNISGPNNENLFASCVSELVLETKEVCTGISFIEQEHSVSKEWIAFDWLSSTKRSNDKKALLAH